MPPVAHTLQRRFPEIEATTRLRTAGKPPITYGDNWLQSNFHTYLLLPDGYNPRRLEAKLQPVIDAKMG